MKCSSETNYNALIRRIDIEFNVLESNFKESKLDFRRDEHQEYVKSI